MKKNPSFKTGQKSCLQKEKGEKKNKIKQHNSSNVNPNWAMVTFYLKKIHVQETIKEYTVDSTAIFVLSF